MNWKLWYKLEKEVTKSKSKQLREALREIKNLFDYTDSLELEAIELNKIIKQQREALEHQNSKVSEYKADNKLRVEF